MFRYFLSTLFSGFFLFYGIITLIFVTPDNFINISLVEYNSKFETFFYQRWGFFAPPPQSNDRLYYFFEKKNNKEEIIVYEVIEPLLKQKYLKAPFNGKEDLVDYLISNSINLIVDGIISVRESIEYDAKLNNIKMNEIDVVKKVNKAIKSTNQFKTLMNYSKKVALNNKIDYGEYNVYLKITQKKVPKFIDRYKKNFKESEQLIFDSTY
jgi:hypothetical protein